MIRKILSAALCLCMLFLTAACEPSGDSPSASSSSQTSGSKSESGSSSSSSAGSGSGSGSGSESSSGSSAGSGSGSETGEKATGANAIPHVMAKLDSENGGNWYLIWMDTRMAAAEPVPDNSELQYAFASFMNDWNPTQRVMDTWHKTFVQSRPDANTYAEDFLALPTYYPRTDTVMLMLATSGEFEKLTAEVYLKDAEGNLTGDTGTMTLTPDGSLEDIPEDVDLTCAASQTVLLDTGEGLIYLSSASSISSVEYEGRLYQTSDAFLFNFKDPGKAAEYLNTSAKLADYRDDGILGCSVGILDGLDIGFQVTRFEKLDLPPYESSVLMKANSSTNGRSYPGKIVWSCDMNRYTATSRNCEENSYLVWGFQTKSGYFACLVL